MASFRSFKNSFTGIVAEEGDEHYDIRRWADNASRKAKYVTYPEDSADVAKAILYAKAEGLDLAVRGGGHSTSGASSSEGGLVVDLSKTINKVQIDVEKQIAYVGGGATWETLDREALKHGLAGCAGIVNHTGVGGLTLGGGFGYKAGMYGLVIDNLIAATIVTAFGDILELSETENSDLFWAIRGGGGNFGVITEFVFKLHPQSPEAFCMRMMFPENRLSEVVTEIQQYLKTQGPNESFFMIFETSPHGLPSITLSGIHFGDESSARASFKRFEELSPMLNFSRNIPYLEMNALQNPMAGWGGNKLFRGGRLPEISQEAVQKIFDARMKLVTEHPEAQKCNVIFEFYHMEKIVSIPSEATAYASRQPDINVLVAFKWTDGPFSSIAREESRKIGQVIIDAAPDVNVEGVGGYGNYGDTEATQNFDDTKAKALWGPNYTRLQQIKKKYDPDMMFNKWFKIAPAS